MENISNIDDHRCCQCVCGATKFHLLKSGKVQCSKCNFIHDYQWLTNDYYKATEAFIEFLSDKNADLEKLVEDLCSDYDSLENRLSD